MGKKIIFFILFLFIFSSCGDESNISKRKALLPIFGKKEDENAYYYSEDFNIKVVKSSIDFNKNGKDDYEDFLLGAKKDAEIKPRYDGAYVKGGYPPENVGVCTDVVWRAFRQAGYSLKDMVDNDIKKNIGDYPNVKMIDPDIDFRRVKNLQVFFKKYAISLTTDINKIDEWNPGDIVVFKEERHIGIVSDKRNEEGISYIIHNMGQDERDEDFMGTNYMLNRNIPIGHFRFDASKLDKNMLMAWKNPS